MFRAIAEYIMRGRVSAISVALIGSWVPLLNQATVGLVTLRKGWQEGAIVMVWALTPSLIGLWMGNVAVVMIYTTVAVIVVTGLLSVLLRYTVSWPATLAGMIGLSVCAAFVVYISVPNIVEELSAFFVEMLKQSATSGQAQDTELSQWLTSWSANKVTSLIAFWVAMSALAGLLVARWWQALLYNPGGFREEIHRLRLSPLLATSCILVFIYCLSRGVEYQMWANLVGLPLLVAGLGLTHCALTKFKVGVGATIALYVALLLVPPLGLVISAIGFTDVWLDYRKRFNLVQ